MNPKETMLHCTRVNCDYMRLPAGEAGLVNMAELYQRIAAQSLQCAQAWQKESPCPDHEPAVDAFWWAVVAWSDAFGLSIGVDQLEWGKVFVSPHVDFANYLRPNSLPEPIPETSGTPAEIIIGLDTLWMEKVIRLTGKWGLLHHLKDKGAMTEAQRLGEELRNTESPTYKAYLESDLAFFRILFKPLPFSESTRKYIDEWLDKAEEALCPS